MNKANCTFEKQTSKCNIIKQKNILFRIATINWLVDIIYIITGY